jgi:hypothetical protein
MFRGARNWSALSLLAFGACSLDGSGVPADDPPVDAGTTGVITDCAPASKESCYSGPQGSNGHGRCTGGVRTCTAEGVWGICEGEIVPEAEDCSAPEDEDCDGQAPPCLLWARTFGDAGEGSARAAALGAGGELLIAGFADGAVDLGAGAQQSKGTDVMLVRLDAGGAHLGSQLMGNDAPQLALSAAVHPTGASVISGRFRGDIFEGTNLLSSYGNTDLFVAAFAADGNLAWTRAFGSDQDEVTARVAFGQSGSVAVAARVLGQVALGGPLPHAGGSDALVASFSSAGQLTWAKTFGDADEQSAESVGVDPIGDVLVAGWFGGTIDFGDGPHVSAGYADAYLVKLAAADGAVVYSRAFGGMNDQQAVAIAVDSHGAVCLAGSFASSFVVDKGTLTSAGDLDAFVAKIDPTGDTIWARRFGGPGTDVALAVAADPGGGCVIGGGFEDVASFGGPVLESAGRKDAFLVKVDEVGDTVFANRFGDASGDQLGWAVAVDASGAIAFAGGFAGSMEWGEPRGTPSAGGQDGFVIRYAESAPIAR